MGGTTRSSEGLDQRRRKVLFRSWHRGTREMDLIMGRFADATIEQLARDLREQYTIGYSPTNPNRNGAWRSVRVAMSAQRCFTAWKDPIGLPNCTRSFA